MLAIWKNNRNWRSHSELWFMATDRNIWAIPYIYTTNREHLLQLKSTAAYRPHSACLAAGHNPVQLARIWFPAVTRAHNLAGGSKRDFLIKRKETADSWQLHPHACTTDLHVRSHGAASEYQHFRRKLLFCWIWSKGGNGNDRRSMFPDSNNHGTGWRPERLRWLQLKTATSQRCNPDLPFLFFLLKHGKSGSTVRCL